MPTTNSQKAQNLVQEISSKTELNTKTKVPTKGKKEVAKIPKLPKKLEIIRSFECLAQVRYHGKIVKCRVDVLNNGDCQVEFCEPVRAVASGQSVVFYDDQIMLGGGVIEQILDNSTTNSAD